MIDPSSQWGKNDTQKSMEKVFPSCSPFTPRNRAVPSLEPGQMTRVASESTEDDRTLPLREALAWAQGPWMPGGLFC